MNHAWVAPFRDVLRNPLYDWCEQELQARRENDPAKLEIAARLRQETTLSIKDIAGVCL